MCWLWNQEGGRAKYTADNVNIWASMLRKNLTIPHTLACVTNMPEGIDPSIEIIEAPQDFIDIQTPTWKGEFPNCFRRIVLFHPNAKDLFGDRYVSMDLDCVIGGNIDHLFDRDDDLVLYKGTSSARPYNGSMVMMNAGCRPHVYNDFNYENAVLSGKKYTGSDQAWFAYSLGPNENVWDDKDGVHWWGKHHTVRPEDKKIIFFPGNPKPWTICELGLDKHVEMCYKGEQKHNCLVVGYGKEVWKDFEALNVQNKKFSHIICSPEAEKYFKKHNPIISDSDKKSLAIANMLGYENDNIYFCGQRNRENIMKVIFIRAYDHKPVPQQTISYNVGDIELLKKDVAEKLLKHEIVKPYIETEEKTNKKFGISSKIKPSAKVEKED